MWKEKSQNNSNSATISVSTTFKHIQENLETSFVPNKGLVLSNGIKVVNVIEFEDNHPFVIRFSEDNDMWAIGFQNGKIGLYPSLETAPTTLGCATQTVELSADGETLAVTDVRFYHCEKRHIKAPKLIIATYATGYVRLWDFETNNQIHQLKKVTREESERIDAHLDSRSQHFNTILCCSLSYDNKRFVTGGSDCAIRVYNTETFKVTTLCQSTMGRDKMDGHVMKVCAVKYHPLGAEHIEYAHVFLSGGWDDAIMIWDDRNGSSLWQYHGTHICGNDALDILTFPNMLLGGNWNRETPLFHVYEFHVKSLSNFDSSHTLNPTAKYILKDNEADKECKPVYSLTQNAITAPSMPYVALWLTKNLIVVAGGNNNCFNIINWKETNIVAAVKDFENAIYSLAYKKHARSSQPYTIAFVTGKYVYVMEFAREITNLHVKTTKTKTN